MIDFLLLGFLTGLSFILAIGAQNIFVIEQGLKNQYIFIVCILCSLSDVLLIFFGVFIFYILDEWIDDTIHLILNIILIGFLLHFIISKWFQISHAINFNTRKTSVSLTSIIYKTLAFTYLNPHVYSDTVFLLGNFSKDFSWHAKIFFACGASLASILFFFTLGYAAHFSSHYLKKTQVWYYIHYLIIIIMSIILTTIIWDVYKTIMPMTRL